MIVSPLYATIKNLLLSNLKSKKSVFFTTVYLHYFDGAFAALTLTLTYFSFFNNIYSKHKNMC